MILKNVNLYGTLTDITIKDGKIASISKTCEDPDDKESR